MGFQVRTLEQGSADKKLQVGRETSNMKSMNVLGFGTMGMQVSAFFSVIGYKVTVWNHSFANDKIRRFTLEKRIIGKKLERVTEDNEVTFLDDINALPPGLTIEALIEDLSIKQRILQRLPFELPDPWLFTNSSSFSPTEIHDRAHALHFFNPLHAVKLVETTLPIDSLPMLKDIQDAGMCVVQTKGNRGNIANVVLFSEIAASIMLVEKFSYDTKTIDLVLEKLGRQSSIFDVVDFVGVDVTKSILENLHEKDNSIAVPKSLDRALASEILGRKNKTTIRSILDAQEKY